MNTDRFARVSIGLLDFALYQMRDKQVRSEPEKYKARISVNGKPVDGKPHSKHVTGKRDAA